MAEDDTLQLERSSANTCVDKSTDVTSADQSITTPSARATVARKAIAEQQQVVSKDHNELKQPSDPRVVDTDPLKLDRSSLNTTQAEIIGNDRVTVDDPPKQPLPTSDTNENDRREDELGDPSNKLIATQSTTQRLLAGPESTAKLEGLESTTSSAKTSSEREGAGLSSEIEPPPHRDDNVQSNAFQLLSNPGLTMGVESEVGELALGRAPGFTADNTTSFIRPSDKSIDDARKRLRTALEQTFMLRKAFTERVYGKYRVCLRRPSAPSVVQSQIEQDPDETHQRLSREMIFYRDEKEIEKKFANKVNTEVDAIQHQLQQQEADTVTASPGTIAAAQMLRQGHVDHADQLMYFSAGLNLIILPEEDMSESEQRTYDERCPIHPSTGQRVKSISLAAATAGDVMLERKRKAMVLRTERQQSGMRSHHEVSGLSFAAAQKPFVASTTAAPPASEATSGIATLQLATKQPSAKKAANAGMPPPNAKSSRSRVSTGVSFGHLLSLNPTAEEFVRPPQEIKTYAPSTQALLAVGSRLTGHKSAQQRLRHPHPESLGGRRRAGINPGQAPISSDEPFSTSHLALTLPPLPGGRDGADRKAAPICSQQEVETERSMTAVKKVLQNFTSDENGKVTRDITKISLLHGLSRLASKDKGEASALEESRDVTSSLPSTLDPIFTFSVLRAVGLLKRAPSTTGNRTGAFLPEHDVENTALCTPRLMRLHQQLEAADDASLTSSFFSGNKRRFDTYQVPSSKKRKVGSSEIPIESIRGGGADSHNIEADEKKEIVGKPTKTKQNTQGSRKMSDDSGTSTKSAPLPSSSNAMSSVGRTVQSPPVHMFNMQMMAPMGNPHMSAATLQDFHSQSRNHAMHLANMHPLHHSSAGDLAGTNGIARQPYDLSQLGTTAISGYGGMGPNMGGYALPNGTMARTLMVRDQQVQQAALLANNSSAAFSTAGTHAQAMMGNQHVNMFGTPMNLGTSASHLTAAHMMRMGQSNDPLRPTSSMHAPKSMLRGKIDTSSNSGETAAPPVKTTTGKAKSSKVAPSEKSKDTAVNNHSATILNNSVQCLVKGDAINGAKDDGVQKPKTDESGMKYCSPKIPAMMTPSQASLIKKGYFHDAISSTSEAEKRIACLQYMIESGEAVPIPKNLVLTPLRDRLVDPDLKIPSSGLSLVPRETVAATILVWLWAIHEAQFQAAFEKSGRIDVDHDCKFLIQTAVDASVREISSDMFQSFGMYTEAASLKKNFLNSKSHAQGTALVEAGIPSKELEIRIVSVVSKALMIKLHVDPFANRYLPHLEQLISYLGESRIGALRAKSQERVLLANLLTRKTMISESFSHAYVGAIVRAGEALGHGKLFEVSQNETLLVSTMIPYDIFTDETGAWEDPCKTNSCFTPGLTGDDLYRRAHARAMFHKSLRKIQDRNNIRGGVTDSGPYAENAEKDSRGQQDATPAMPAASRPGPKRKYPSISGPPAPPGTGFASASSWAVYQPIHVSETLEWYPNHLENKPYGRFRRGDRATTSSVSLSARSGEARNTKKAKRPSSIAVDGLKPSMPCDTDEKLPKGTLPIYWGEVASIFRKVEVPRRGSSRRLSRSRSAAGSETEHRASGNIFAPFCQKVEGSIPKPDDSSSDEEEDVSDETILSNHQAVLDEMKAKIQAYMDTKKKQKDQKDQKRHRMSR